jgi:hypothetical protein
MRKFNNFQFSVKSRKDKQESKRVDPCRTPGGLKWKTNELRRNSQSFSRRKQFLVCFKDWQMVRVGGAGKA